MKSFEECLAKQEYYAECEKRAGVRRREDRAKTREERKLAKWKRIYIISICVWVLLIVYVFASQPVFENDQPNIVETVEEPVIAESIETIEAIPKAPEYTEDDLETLALIIYQEAGGDSCSDETRLMVGTVVLNRVADDRYPDTIDEVATQYKQYGRLCWTGLVWPERASKAEEAEAVERAYDCAKQLLEGYRALPSDVIYQAEFTQGTETVAYQDGFYFCR